jgi:hypothetical protein
MFWYRASVLLCVATLFIGCRRTPDEMAVTPPVSEKRLQELRRQYQASDGEALLGRVTDVRHLDRLAEIRDIDVEPFRIGEVISFIDGNEQFLTNGTVVRKLSDALHVEYVEPTVGARAPQIGDLAIRFRR